MNRIPDEFYGLLGLVIGSFLNVCIHRLPRGESIVWPGSHCPSCKRRLGPLELVPVLSWVALRGRCKSCGIRIAPRYAIVELITGAAFYWAARSTGDNLSFLSAALFLSGLIVIFYIDLDCWIIPDVVIAPLMVVGLAVAAVQGRFADSAIAAVAGYATLYMIRMLGSLLAGKEAMGFGDVKMAAFMGAFLGVKLLFTGLFTGFLVGGVFSLVVLTLRKRGVKDEIPFGPMLAAGGAIALIKGRELLEWYSNFSSRLWPV